MHARRRKLSAMAMRGGFFIILLLLVLSLIPALPSYAASSAAEESSAPTEPLSSETIETGSATGFDENGKSLSTGSDEASDDSLYSGENSFFGFHPGHLRKSVTLPWYAVLLCLGGMILPIIGIIMMLRRGESRAATMLLVADVVCFFYNATHFLHLNAASLDEAILTLKMNFLEALIFYFFFILFMLYYLEKRAFLAFIIYAAIAGFTIAVIWDNRFSALIYTDLRFVTDEIDGSPVSGLYFGRGLIFFLGTAYLALILLIIFGITLSKFRKSDVPFQRSNMMRLMASQILAMLPLVFYVIPGTNPNLNPVPFLASLSVFVLTSSVMGGKLFGVVERSRSLVFEQGNQAYVTVTADLEYLDSNGFAKKLFPSLTGLVTGADLPADVSETIVNAQMNDDAVMEKTLDGEKRYYRVIFSPLTVPDDSVFKRRSKKLPQDQQEHVDGYTLLIIDTTEQYELFREANIQREKALEAAKAKSDFLSNMSHEIRTPMNAIVGMAEILMRDDLPAQSKEYLLNIKHSGDALLSIINDILDFSKLESGKLEIINDDYEPDVLLSELLMIFRTRIGERPIRLVYDIDKNLPHTLCGDSIRIRQVLTNIMNNAIKFTEEGWVKLTLSVKHEDNEKVRLFFAVEDTGQGIREKDLPKLFGSFSQVDTKKNRQKEGTGLGLAISKTLVEQMGGTISVSSTYGKGSVFSFDIVNTISSNSSAGSDHDGLTASGSRSDAIDFIAPEANILIVDDNEMNLKVAKGLLAPLQMNIETASSGQAALDMINDDAYDIIFMDHMMPGMDGVECTKLLRDRESGYMKSVPVIALTANAVSGAKEEFLKAGMNDFVPKPIEMSTICAKIKKYLPPEKVRSEKVELNTDSGNDISAFSDLDGSGIDVRAGIKNSGSAELYKSFLGDYFRLIDLKTAKLKDCLENGLIKDYTIEVHALKSTSRTIGAMELGDSFFRLEQLGDASDVDAIMSETPAVIDAYNALKPYLSPYAAADTDNEDLREAEADEIIDLLSAIKETADAFDLDGCDAALKELLSIKLPSGISERIPRLQALVTDVATDEIITEADQMIEIMQHN